MTLPESWQFLGKWWWVLHAVAIALVFYLGYVIGKSNAEEASRDEKGDDGEKKW